MKILPKGTWVVEIPHQKSVRIYDLIADTPYVNDADDLREFNESANYDVCVEAYDMNNCVYFDTLEELAEWAATYTGHRWTNVRAIVNSLTQENNG